MFEGKECRYEDCNETNSKDDPHEASINDGVNTIS